MKKRFPIGLENDPFFARFAGTLPSIFEAWDRNLNPLWSENTEGQIMSPAVDIIEEGDKIVVKADMPGLCENEIEVICMGDRLVLKAERTNEREGKKGDHHVTERHIGSFQRTLPLPFRVTDTAAINADYDKGVLKIEIPKPEEEQSQQRRVKIHFQH